MMQMKVATPCLILALGGFGCASDTTNRSGTLPWNEGEVQVVGADREVTDVAIPEGDGCLNVGEEFADPANCIKPQEECEGGSADVLLDSEGKVLDTLCFPTSDTITVAEIEANDGGVSQNQNNAVIVLDSNPAVDLAGDLSVDANNVIIFGADPATSVVDGDLTVDGNNTIVRGVTITGDVNVVKNDATFFFCVLKGDVTIVANNTVIAGCDVLGKLTIEGNNTKLVGNHFVNAPEIKGSNTECEGNLEATDANGNGVLETEELGKPLNCK